MPTTKILSIGTALPPHEINQEQAYDFVASLGLYSPSQLRLIRHLYQHSDINKRHSVLPDFNQQMAERKFFKGSQQPTTAQRMKAYQEHALALSMQSVKECMAHTSIHKSEISHLITVSCTGMYAPGLDIDLVKNLGLESNVKRTCVNFMGCYAAFNALKLADSICRADAGSKVLVVCTELCTLHFKPEDQQDFILSNSLFADGSAAVLLSAEGEGMEITHHYSDIIDDSQQHMAWHIGDLGFEMTLSRKIPDLLKEKALIDILRMLYPELSSMDDLNFAIHPGGKRIIESAGEALCLNSSQLEASYKVLRHYGNMSSASILFILKEMKDLNKPIIAMAFGPGLTVETMLLNG